MLAPAPLAGRVALGTGASRRSAIGAAIVQRLAGDGAAVLVHSRVRSAHLIPRGITVNCVTPGPHNTGYADDAAWAWVARGCARHATLGRPRAGWQWALAAFAIATVLIAFSVVVEGRLVYPVFNLERSAETAALVIS